MCTSQEAKRKIVQLILCSVSIVFVRTKYMYTVSYKM